MRLRDSRDGPIVGQERKPPAVSKNYDFTVGSDGALGLDAARYRDPYRLDPSLLNPRLDLACPRSTLGLLYNLVENSVRNQDCPVQLAQDLEPSDLTQMNEG